MSPRCRDEAVTEGLDGTRRHLILHDVERSVQDDSFSSSGSWHNREDTNGDRSTHSTNGRSVRSGDDSDGAESTNGKNSDGTEFLCLDNDAIWIPPEAADKEDEAESAARYIDDDEYSDGIKWGRSSFSGTGEEHEAGPNPREERQKAMLEAMNGQLKILVSRFLASAGIPFPKGGESSESWLDVVTSLSWEAALLIKPDATVGKEMDPGSYIKIKCIASGTRRQCEVIKGLVFKKNAAHKHMPARFHNPRLLLLKGVLGHSDVGLSSFNSMEQEKDHLEKSISKMMEICNPNVIMVEKTVSRDIQELLVKEGVTLVLDMKLNRLGRIARCTGSSIISFSEVLNRPKLKQCDYFHIEKIVEEHNNTGDGGKRPSKTLLFLEGFPRPLGCTILLRGANLEELKKVKQVMHYTVFAAYHLILETSFFEDQRVFLNDKNSSKEENSVTTKAGSSVISYETAALSNGSIPGNPVDNDAPALKLYPATSNGSVGEYPKRNTVPNSPTNPDAQKSPIHSFSHELGESTIIQYDSVLPPSEELPSSFSGSLRIFIDMFHHQNIYLPVTSSQETDRQKEGRFEINQEMASNGFNIGAKVDVSADASENLEDQNDLQKQGSLVSSQGMALIDASTSEKPEEPLVPVENEEQHSSNCLSKEKIVDDDEVDDVLDSQSILILMSSQCITKQAICEQSHLSRIKYYGDFDVSLGRYLQDILQNQNLSCSLCGEPPEAHMYSYTYRNGNVTVLVRRLLPQHHLPGESEGKIWMWTRCLRCEHESGISKMSRRVLISAEACNLSFGKFLELSFSSHSAARRLSICGHLVNRDCLRFFGLGSKVAMFRYSSVEIYTACKPQPTLEFHAPNRQDWLKEEEIHVLARGAMLFSEIASVLQHLKNQYPDSTSISYGAVKAFSQLEEMLRKEKDDFEDSLVKAIDQGGIPSSSVHELLDVNWLYQDLLLELYIWDRRLHQLIECKPAEQDSVPFSCKDPEVLVSSISGGINEINKETDDLTCSRATTIVQASDIVQGTTSKLSIDNGSAETGKVSKSGNNEYAAPLVDGRLGARPLQDNTARTPKDPSFVISNGLEVKSSGSIANPTTMKQELPSIPQQLGSSDWDDRARWIWDPFSESSLAYRKDLQVGSLEKFELINHYSPSRLSPLHEQSAEDSLQFTVGPGGNILCVSEDEISSIISRALAISEDRRHLLDAIIENQTGDTKGEHTKTMEKSYSFASESSFTSSSWSSVGSSDSDASFSSVGSSFSSEDLSGYDSSLHPEIPVNGKVALRGKYSVTCIYANWFYTLRKKCCPSELAYITSLSRCKKWDAQGGKSKAFFAKTMDDRFIIKQIKKTEFESFIKFGPYYFKHVYCSLDTGSQTCLGKILGIYQVKHIRHGKEVKIDLMVMENLLFGRNISRIYDLKGTVFSRYVSDCEDRDTVYLDQNFVEDMRVSPIYISGRTKHLFQRAIWNDTSFLTSINVMDYSLLVGVDRQKHELVFGIIDYLREYTWDKQLETWVKTSLVVPKNVSPTVISPKEYKKRFRKFMTKYFLTVPDNWSPENYSRPCNLCSPSNNKLSEVHDEKPLQHQIEACA